MRHHSRNERGIMGAAILAVLGIFLGLHLLLPEATLWPFAIIALIVVTMLVSHSGKSSHSLRKLAHNAPESQNQGQ